MMHHTRTIVALAALAAGGLILSAAARPQVGVAPRPDADTAAYGVGFYVGEEIRAGLEEDGLELNTQLVARGFIDGLEGRDPRFDREEIEAVLQAVHEEMEARMVARWKKEDPAFAQLAADNLEKAKAFIEAQQEDPFVKTLPSGALYKVVASGDGPSPTDGDRIVVNYKGLLIDGRTFDAGEAIELEMNDLRRGGGAVLEQMQVGDHWYVALPPDLAYGEAGHPPRVGPNEAVIFDVELLEVKKGGDR